MRKADTAQKSSLSVMTKRLSLKKQTKDIYLNKKKVTLHKHGVKVYHKARC